jgi:hypothetical protein
MAMKITVDAETLRVTTKCPDFACLSSSRQELCKIRIFNDGFVQFTQCACLKKCNYQSPFGTKSLCNCPTRKEIYSRYQI